MITIERLFPDVRIPMRATSGSVGYDVYAYLRTETGRDSKLLIPPNTTKVIPTGLKLMCDAETFILACSRSGLAMRSVFLANAPGIIDPDYRGELRILLYNGGWQNHWIEHGDRIAQLIPAIVDYPGDIFIEGTVLDNTERSVGGFGSTGR